MLDLEIVSERERETVRAFAVDLDPHEAKRWVQVHSNLEAALGVDLDPAHLESFPSEDLTGMGLGQFLIDGYGIAETDIPQDRTELDTAGPQILLVRARAFGGKAVSLSPKPPLIPLGAFMQAGAELPGPTPQSAVEAGTSGGPPKVQSTQKPNTALIAILIFLGLAVILFAILIVAKL